MIRWLQVWAYSVIGFTVAMVVTWILSIELSKASMWTVYGSCAATAFLHQFVKRKDT